MSVADNDRMEEHLREWAHWLTLGGCGDGYAAINVLHESWCPPSPGSAPSFKVGRADVRERMMHGAVKSLSRRLQATLLVHYCKRLPVAEQALVLECSESTVHARLREAKRQLAAELPTLA